ncbi:ribbon-helix-helix domain-containing protein [Mesorhizobium sp. CAU 1732]|uniref:ribbon-helix-helix domain-containing protein n=1 Tax=Mesorhizobium sp. CAU 1732 TaxID=3140358 RepID=UPI0032615257
MSAVIKRSISIRGHRTSFSLEQPFYAELLRIAAERNVPLAGLVGQVDAERARDTNLSSALRLFVLDWFRERPGAQRQL